MIYTSNKIKAPPPRKNEYDEKTENDKRSGEVIDVAFTIVFTITTITYSNMYGISHQFFLIQMDICVFNHLKIYT